MRRGSLFLLLLATARGALAAGAATPQPPAAVEASADEAAVRAVIDRFFLLAQKRDWDAVAELFAPDFVLFTDGAASFRKAEYVELLKADDLVVTGWELADVELAVSADGRMAWSRYRGEIASTSRGAPHNVTTAETLILRRDAERWQIVHAHASVRAAEPAAP